MKKLLIALALLILSNSASAQPPGTGQDAEGFLAQTKEFLEMYVLPDIELEIGIYSSAGLPAPAELLEIRNLGRGVETMQDLEAFDRAVQNYVQSGPTLPNFTEEQIRTIAKGYMDILQKISAGGMDTGNLTQLLEGAKTNEDIRQFFSSLSSLMQPQGAPQPRGASLPPLGSSPPSTGAAASARGAAEVGAEPLPSEAALSGAKEGEPTSIETLSAELAETGTFEEMKETMQVYLAAIAKAGADTKETEQQLSDAAEEKDLLPILSSLASFAEAFPLPPLDTLFEVSFNLLISLQEDITHLSTASPLPPETIRSKLDALEAERLLLQGSPEEQNAATALFLSNLNAALGEIFAPEASPGARLPDLRTELLTLLSDLSDLLSTTVINREELKPFEDVFLILQTNGATLKTSKDIEAWFNAHEQRLAGLRSLLPSPSMEEVRSDLLSVLASLEQHLATLEVDELTAPLQPQLQLLRSSLASLSTETELDAWFMDFDSFFSLLTRNES
jgi:hypothetical protein